MTPTPAPSARAIVLTGFMGAGKTTVGLELARLLERPFIDVDEEIEKRYGMPVTEIFRTLGEAEFRRAEREKIAELCGSGRPDAAIVSLGGGAYMQDVVREMILSSAFVVFLDISWDVWLVRMPQLAGNRPMLQTRTLDQVKELYDTRREVYAINHYRVLTDGLPPAEIAQRIVQAFTPRR